MLFISRFHCNLLLVECESLLVATVACTWFSNQWNGNYLLLTRWPPAPHFLVVGDKNYFPTQSHCCIMQPSESLTHLQWSWCLRLWLWQFSWSWVPGRFIFVLVEGDPALASDTLSSLGVSHDCQDQCCSVTPISTDTDHCVLQQWTLHSSLYLSLCVR